MRRRARAGAQHPAARGAVGRAARHFLFGILHSNGTHAIRCARTRNRTRKRGHPLTRRATGAPANPAGTRAARWRPGPVSDTQSLLGRRRGGRRKAHGALEKERRGRGEGVRTNSPQGNSGRPAKCGAQPPIRTWRAAPNFTAGKCGQCTLGRRSVSKRRENCPRTRGRRRAAACSLGRFGGLGFGGRVNRNG